MNGFIKTIEQGLSRVAAQSRAAGYATIVLACALLPFEARGASPEQDKTARDSVQRLERIDDPYVAPLPRVRHFATSGRSFVMRGEFVSVQVNVDEFGQNILGDAANEPSIAVDPTNPARMAIGWRQFDTVNSNFRQAGWGYTGDGGQTWTFPGVLEPGVFRSDPVLEFDSQGNFYYYSLHTPGGNYCCDVWKSTDGGVTWNAPTFAHGGDKGWFTIDRTGGPGAGHIYTTWNDNFACTSGDFAMSRNGNVSFEDPFFLPGSPFWGTLSVGPFGELFICGNGFTVLRSDDAQEASGTPTFQLTSVNLGGSLRLGAAPNPAGLLGQAWIATDHSQGPTRGNVYLLASVYDFVTADPLDVMFARSTDGGVTWTDPIRVNDDPTDNNAWQWFGTMSVAPNGRIDVIWNDTRNSGVANLSELYYASSMDAGETWSENVPVSPVFDSHVGWPNQNKIGDYYDMVSDYAGANLAYAATFNGEQDVYYVRLGDSLDCNGNGILDVDDIANKTSTDCNGNGFPDECEPDCNDNMLADACEVADGSSPDCDGNFIPDECDPDFDGDGDIDACDDDIDNDEVANELDFCDFTPPGSPVTPDGRHISDTNGNCVIDLTDYGRLRQRCLILGGPNTPTDDPFCLSSFDLDGDTDIDLRDVAGFMNSFGL